MTNSCHIRFDKIMISNRKGYIDMDYEIITLREKIVAGIADRTNNAATDMKTVIEKLWKRFYEDGIYEKIPNKASKSTLGIYTDYASDENDDYTVMICCEIKKKPKDFKYIIRKIPAGTYAKFVVKGNVQTTVAKAWQEIWQMDLPRAFNCDFEEYLNDNMEHTEIHLYIGLKE